MKMTGSILNKTALCVMLLSLSVGASAKTHPAAADHGGGETVNVKIVNAQGTEIGTATLTQNHDAVRLHVEAKNLPPGMHGIHFHETGKCEGQKFESAGAHLNPNKKQHGFNNPQGFHVGDLPNIQVAADGTVKVDIETKIVTLEPNKPNSLKKAGGSALVIHAQEDDYKTDPSGNSGDRIACGVIQ
ncbi:Cu-Zn family superoxide dismutase [Paenibacillus taihuensis]|uniref:Superoxide dismutase [Cu-Zn] n=1 Tax=Paenibacillus taihuensis TaxID=1156355 RepID=A0A3D9RUM1_9BACL|nr:superoxide dismutase family protein [Paenibacillus taihuensis]REE81244.1 Cu-Zn family superoxide dismutase [Paenibacillus taihuensis]